MRKTILVIDDFVNVRDLICETLQSKGYDTLPASNAAEAYAILTQHAGTINLVLADYTMADGSGYDLLIRIRANNALAGTAVVFLTTEHSPEKIEAARVAGLAGWIRKPYKAETFFNQIENAMAGRAFRTHP
jgi:CheY-like chemotaxis protein